MYICSDSPMNGLWEVDTMGNMALVGTLDVFCNDLAAPWEDGVLLPE